MAAIYALAFGTTLGVAVMSLVLVPPAWRLGYRPQVAFGHPALLAALRLAAPVFIFTAATVGVQMAVNLFGSASAASRSSTTLSSSSSPLTASSSSRSPQPSYPSSRSASPVATLTVSARTSHSGSG